MAFSKKPLFGFFSHPARGTTNYNSCVKTPATPYLPNKHKGLRLFEHIWTYDFHNGEYFAAGGRTRDYLKL